MEVPHELQTLVDDTLIETYLKAKNIWHRHFVLPRVVYSTILGKKGGTANLQNNVIHLNVAFLVHYREKFMETVIHEAAHLITDIVYPKAKQHHGPEFKHVDILLGGRGTRCHSYDVCIALPHKRFYTYACRTCQREFSLSQRMHNGILRDGDVRICVKCKTDLVFVGVKNP